MFVFTTVDSSIAAFTLDDICLAVHTVVGIRTCVTCRIIIRIRVDVTIGVRVHVSD
jgi:hypothetical protein